MKKTYWVNIRNMHNAIHTLFLFNNKKDAEKWLKILKKIENAETEEEIDILWEKLNEEVDYTNYGEIHYRWIKDWKEYKEFDDWEDQKILIINDNSVDIHL